jgi:C-methyltransferase
MTTALSPTDTESTHATTEPPAPHELIWTLTNAYVPSTSLHLVAELGVADHIGQEPVSVEQLASCVGADPDALDRVLSLLSAHGLFARHGRRYVHTPASRLLRSDHPKSMRAFPRMNGLPFVWHAFSNLEHSVRTGVPVIETTTPGGLWAYLQDHPDEARIFAQAMTARAAGDIDAILGAYAFSRFETLADIAGGRGHLIERALDSAPGSRGILFDLPAVIETLDIRHERLALHAGDFFVDPLPRADAYVLMEILHDWADEQCVQILSAIRRAAAPGATVLVIENVLADRGIDPGGHNLDVIMLALTGGRERTPGELNQLFGQSGFSDGTVIETASRLRIVEATAL